MFAPITTNHPQDTFFFERHLMTLGYTAVAGIDEAGRGPLAGPVCAACVILTPDCNYQLFKDSKQLSPRQREALFEMLIHSSAQIGTGSASPREIETINILQATLLAMQRAVDHCAAIGRGKSPDYLLVDGRSQVPLAIDQKTLIKGESKSASIAAASIIAKVQRDRLMLAAHQSYPCYGFDRHQGYPTQIHRQAIQRHGPCPLHRRTFRGVREFCSDVAPKLVQKQTSIW